MSSCVLHVTVTFLKELKKSGVGHDFQPWEQISDTETASRFFQHATVGMGTHHPASWTKGISSLESQARALCLGRSLTVSRVGPDLPSGMLSQNASPPLKSLQAFCIMCVSNLFKLSLWRCTWFWM